MPNMTQLILIAVILGLILYDVYAGRLGQPTESMVLRDWARDWTLLAFTAGFLLGHWFGPRVNADVSGWMWALPIMALLLGVDIGWNVWGKNGISVGVMFPNVGRYLPIPVPWWRYSLLYALAGIPVGILIWPQPGSWSIIP